MHLVDALIKMMVLSAEVDQTVELLFFLKWIEGSLPRGQNTWPVALSRLDDDPSDTITQARLSLFCCTTSTVCGAGWVNKECIDLHVYC